MENVPLHYQKFEKVFGKEMQSELPEHGPQDIAINLLPDAQLPAAKLYPMSQDELQCHKPAPEPTPHLPRASLRTCLVKGADFRPLAK